MRLERLDLGPYGHFENRTLHFSRDAALHVVLGANESGKTTTLEAIGDLMFGVRDRTTYAFAYEYKALRIGGALRRDDGEQLELRRRKGDKNTLLDAEGKPVPEEPLRRALGLDRKTFESEFGLNQRSLREGGEALLRAGGSLAEALAAGSASLSALNDLRKRLTEEADELFGARRVGSKPFYVALDAHQKADGKLKAAIVTADALKAADEARLEAQAQGNDLKAQHHEQGAAIVRRQRAGRVAGKLRRLDALAVEMAALADLPEIDATALDAALATVEAERLAYAEREKWAAEDARDNALRASLGLDEALVAQGQAIDDLREQLGAVRKDEADLPKRIGAQAQARGQLEDLARRLGLADTTALLTFAPPDVALVRLRKLVKDRRAAETRHAEAERRHANALAEQRRLGQADEAQTLDPAPLKRRLDALADALRDAELLRQEQASATGETQAIAEAVVRLDPPAPDADALARLALPDEKTLEARERAEREAEEFFRAAQQKRETARRAAEAAETDLARHERAAAGATRADWDAARALREAALERLGAALTGPRDLREERFETLRARTLAADQTVENVLGDTERATRLQAARETLALRREEFSRAEAELAGAGEALARVRTETASLWRASGIAPRDPAHMTRWGARVAAILQRRTELERRKAESAALAAKVAAARETLRDWLADAGARLPASEAFEESHRAARARLDELQEAKQAAAEGAAKRAQAEKAVAEWAVERDKAGGDGLALAQGWASATAALRLAPETSVEEAEAALDAWAAVPLPRREFEDTGHRIATMKADVERFEREVEAVVTAAAPSLAGDVGREVLPKLLTALAAARKAADERARLDEAAAKRANLRGALEAQSATRAPVLRQVRALTGAEDEGLPAALARLDQRRALEAERARLRRELAENGDGIEEARLREEAAGFDLSTLTADLEVAEQDQKRLLHEIGEAAAATRAAQERRDALAKGRDAAEAARERTEAAGELVDIAERWLARAAAAKLAHLAIERHRAAAQDPLIARAGAFFRVATAESFAGLGVGYDENDHPILVARRAEGKPVEVKGLSEGARDQLFLSLRLALLERREGEPLPFIGDDLLASFDDERTRCTLDLLAEFGARRQTILFTHHARVAEIARTFAGRAVEVIEI